MVQLVHKRGPHETLFTEEPLLSQHPESVAALSQLVPFSHQSAYRSRISAIGELAQLPLHEQANTPPTPETTADCPLATPASPTRENGLINEPPSRNSPEAHLTDIYLIRAQGHCMSKVSCQPTPPFSALEMPRWGSWTLPSFLLLSPRAEAEILIARPLQDLAVSGPGKRAIRALVLMVLAHAKQCLPETNQAIGTSANGALYLAADEHRLAAETGSVRLASVQARSAQSGRREDGSGDSSAEQTVSKQPTPGAFASSRQLADNTRSSQTLAFIILSSGSTDLPKPTFQTHGVCVANYSSSKGYRALLTLPLYHNHGLSIFFRNPCARDDAGDGPGKLPRGATCVKFLSEVEGGAAPLAQCQQVLFGGSSCPDDLGDLHVEQSVRMISHYGATELGQLMTSDRPAGEKAWDYVRPLPTVALFIQMSPLEDDSYECVVLDVLPTKVSSNQNRYVQDNLVYGVGWPPSSTPPAPDRSTVEDKLSVMARLISKYSIFSVTAADPYARDPRVVYHVQNSQTSRWTEDLLPALRRAGLDFAILPKRESGFSEEPDMKRLDFFTDKYDNENLGRSGWIFQMEKTEAASPSLRVGVEFCLRMG
ncbi:uncharacterized protein BP01DRAFT_396080 [Aspergillus saccharolyticus JOP 1030-1]|uniref:AMP-dependent synthetase/ligase domain-containing protein n=1 Tax=Aspergillus saccharolyticus JOP 1030-1 TaxID=1450539 RepID=A0A318YZM8_9EURO|nr:hypothetical protein BP01DRAFT_396080 [Aspergillus saccharolyticus JOP 1030-1]PYH40166.1 hypothetical protein BP01DRAFT_396080 [Aspergillus saccharolyticus JOP 1030-1]